MNEQDIDQVAEIAGTAKQLFRAFEDQLGEVMAAQRLASKEANEALAETRRTLQELLQRAKEASNAANKIQDGAVSGLAGACDGNLEVGRQ